MKKFKINILIQAAALTLLTASGVTAQPEQGVSLPALVKEAVENNPRIQEAMHKWKAAEYRIKSVKSLDDPMVSYSSLGEDVQTRVGPMERRYSVEQKFPFPGKLSLKGKAQRKEALALKEEYEATKNEIIKDVKFVYYDLFWIDMAIQINEEEKAILERLEKVAQRKYESNLAPQQDVIKVQVELSNIIKKLFLLNQNRQSLVVMLNSLLARPPDQALGPVSEIDNYEFQYEMDDIIEKVTHSRQELTAANLSVEKAEYEKSLAHMAYLPDFTLGGEYIEIGGGTTTNINDGQDAWMAMVSVNVPIWFGKLNAQVKEKEAELQAAKEKKEDMENQAVFEAQDIYFKIHAYKDIVLLYETALLPQAQQAYDASQVGFEAGAVSFIDWLDTERTYLQTRLAYYKAIADYHKSIAYLERVAGGEI